MMIREPLSVREYVNRLFEADTGSNTKQVGHPGKNLQSNLTRHSNVTGFWASLQNYWETDHSQAERVHWTGRQDDQALRVRVEGTVNTTAMKRNHGGSNVISNQHERNGDERADEPQQ